MTSKHTPGPWEVLTGLRTVIRGAGHQMVAEITVPYGDDLRGHRVTKANAALIAEAPAMLEALRALLQQCEYIASESPEAMQHPDLVNARAILARLDGEG